MGYTFSGRTLQNHNRLTSLLTYVPLLTEAFPRRLEVPATDLFITNQINWKRKFSNIEGSIFDTGAMMNCEWRETHRRNRHVAICFDYTDSIISYAGYRASTNRTRGVAALDVELIVIFTVNCPNVSS